MVNEEFQKKVEQIKKQLDDTCYGYMLLAVKDNDLNSKTFCAVNNVPELVLSAFFLNGMRKSEKFMDAMRYAIQIYLKDEEDECK